MKTKNRKDQIENVVKQAVRCNGNSEAPLAWARLCGELEALTEPERRMPRFNTLLRAIWTAATNEQS